MSSVEIKDYDGPEVSFGPGRTGDALSVQIKRALAESYQNGKVKQLPVAAGDIDKIAGRIRNEAKRSGHTVSIKTVGGTLLFKVTGSTAPVEDEEPTKAADVEITTAAVPAAGRPGPKKR